MGKISGGGNAKDVNIAVPNFGKTLNISFINCEINFIITWFTDCAISSRTGATKFTITDIKTYVLYVTLSTQSNAELLKQLKLGFQRSNN